MDSYIKNQKPKNWKTKTIKYEQKLKKTNFFPKTSFSKKWNVLLGQKWVEINSNNLSSVKLPQITINK